ncbi:MAG: GPR endopeptidase [Eubacteriales bacterium]|nr:GPR endopeptidase [Eubacteriales bacterium]
MNIRTDLAMEAHDAHGEQSLPGVKMETIGDDRDITICRVTVSEEEGARLLGKPLGTYVTLEVSAMRERDPALEERVSRCIAQEGRNLLGDMKKDMTVLVIGLGNWDITPDSLGPRVVGGLLVTRHLLETVPEEVDERLCALCALAPGVLGVTGIETAEVIRGVVQRVKPDLLIAVDALAARDTARLGITVQLCDAGISPGSGVGNHRMTLSRETLGIPVLSVGVPMVVYAGTIARDVMSRLGGVEETAIEETVNGVLRGSALEMMVTPKEIDQLVEDSARVVANGINLMVHQDLTLAEVERYLH